jgi:hypothetical protein
MFAKVKSPTFIDTLRVELASSSRNSLKAVLRDDSGNVCRNYETDIELGQPEITLKGLNDLPYGVYTLEIIQGEDQVRLRMVKRV